MSIKDKLREGKFIVTAEATPPKGTDVNQMLKLAEELTGAVDAINITDSPMAKMKLNSVIASHLIQKHTQMETIPHITCRDKNIIAIQSELLGATNLGVKNILAITGDDPTAGDHPQASPVFDIDSIGIIKTVQKLNQGFDYNDNQLNQPTDLTVGTAANLGAKDLDKEIVRLKEKVAAGADFIQTQPAYDIQTLKRFLAKTEEIEIPILIGILPLTSYKMAQYLANNVPGVEIPPEILARMEDKGLAEGVNLAREFLSQAQKLIEGVHLMSANRSDILLNILEVLS